MVAHDIESAARDAAGNWQHFDSFVWHRGSELDDAENWTIVSTSNRDSGLMEQSNASAILEILGPFLWSQDNRNPDVLVEHSYHWACGYVDGYAIRVYRDGKITPAFRAWISIVEALEDYPLLDDEDHSRREYESTLENMGTVARDVDGDYELPDGWKEAVFSWLWEHDQRELDPVDDGGAWPSPESLKAAFDALGYPNLDEEDEEDDEPDATAPIKPAPGQLGFGFLDSE